MQEKSLKVLEFYKIRDMLVERAASGLGKARCAALVPVSDIREIERMQAETEEASTLVARTGVQPISAFDDVQAQVARAKVGGILSPKDLLLCARLMQTARSVRRTLVGEKDEAEETETPHLVGLARALYPMRRLEEEIFAAILSEEEIADSASPGLASVRRKIRSANERIRDKLNGYLHSSSMARYLQDAIITMRQGRYVLPVRAEYRSQVPGIVHDQSSSGATLFIEPMAIVEINNDLRGLMGEERAEIEKILQRFSEEISQEAGALLENQRILAELDFIFAKGALARQMRAVQPKINEAGYIDIKRGRHPLIDPEAVVPSDLWIGKDFTTLVVTGPNTGGKTVTLKTIGLMCAMAACGLHLPVADGSCVPVFDAVLADIGDEQSIEQSLSTFSSHMTNIVRILNECGPNTLILFDELGAGTDPTEGAALAISIIEYARARGAVIAATTHYAELKVYATTAKGVMNASCEFDVATLRPTYRLLVGIPGKSNAFAISERLGVPAEIIADAKGRVGTESASFEATIEKLESVRQALERDRDEAQKKLREAEENRKESAKIKIVLSMRLEKAELKAKRDAERIIAEARETAEAAFAEIDEMRARMNDEEDHRAANEARAALRRRLNEAEESFAEKPAMPEEKRGPTRPAVVGDTVELLSMGVKAEVTGINKDGSLSLRAGIMNVTARQEEVRVTEAQPKKKVASTGNTTFRQAAVAPELDLRGMETLEAIPVMERYIDSAVMGKLHTVTIIHGKGTGALRQAVQQALRKNKAVKSFRLGRYGEGETGVTVVELK